MSYRPVAIYDLATGDFVGHAIKKSDFPKFHSVNIYLEGEETKLNEQLARLNEDVDLRRFWPNPKDPEVLVILADENFMPIEYMQAEVVDDENSYYVWHTEQEVDAYGNPIFDPATGQPSMIQSDKLDEEASVIVTKMANVPKNPAHLQLRIKKACEVIARRRAGIA